MKSSTTLAALVAHCRKLAGCKHTSDAELLRRFVEQREAAAFEELLERYAPMVWGVCRRILPNEADCEDALQAAFVSLFRQAGSIDPNRPLGAWLHTIAVRTAAKARSRIHRLPTSAATPEQATHGDIADELGTRELFRVVDEEIVRLPALLREPFVLCCLEGRTRDEAAAALHCSVSAIKRRLERSRNLLRKRLERRGFGLPAAFLVLGLTGGQVQAALRAKAFQCVFGSVPSAVAALVPAAGVPLASKLALTAMSLVVVGALSFGAFHVLQTEPPQETPTKAKEIASPSPSAEKTQSQVDGYGDPLPPGAIRRFGTLRFRHPEIAGLAFTPDGNRLIAGSGRHPLWVFDGATGQRLRVVGKDSSNNIHGFALSPDGKRVACCGSDVFVWDIETGQLVRECKCGPCESVAFSPDGKKLVAVKQFRAEVVVVEVGTGKHLGEWTIKEGSPLQFGFGSLTFSQDGKFLAGCVTESHEERPFIHRAISSHVWVFDSSSWEKVRVLDLPSVSLACAFQPGTGRLATLGRDGILRFWDVRTGKEVQHLPATKGGGHDFSYLPFSADGTRCAVVTDQGKCLSVLDTKDGRVIRRIEGEEIRMWRDIALSSDGKTLASATGWESPCVRVWDVASGVERLADAGHRAVLTAFSLFADGRTLVSRDEDGKQIHWNLRTAKAMSRTAVARDEGGELIWNGDFTQMTLRGSRWRVVYRHEAPRQIEIWSLDRVKMIRKLTWQGYNGPTVGLSPDGAQLAIAEKSANGNNCKVMVWEPEREETPRTLPGSPKICWDFLFSHDGKRLITRSGYYPVHSKDAGAVWIWDIAQERLVRKLVTDGVPTQLRLTADDQVLLAGIGGGKDATIRAWDMVTGKELARSVDPSLKPLDEINYSARPVISGLAVSADDRFVAAVSSWGDVSALSVWETGTSKIVRAFAPVSPRNNVKAMLFSRDGRSLFVANSDATILEWDVSGRSASGRRQPAGETPNQDRLNALWKKLAETPDQAYPAAWEMLDHPAESLSFLVGKLAPVKSEEEKRVRRLLSRLDSESFAEREQAGKELLALGKQWLPLLRQESKNGRSLEARKRLEGIMESLNGVPTPDQLRLLRAVAVLEWSNQPQAAAHLRRLAGGAPNASLTQGAKAALLRLTK